MRYLYIHHLFCGFVLMHTDGGGQMAHLLLIHPPPMEKVMEPHPPTVTERLGWLTPQASFQSTHLYFSFSFFLSRPMEGPSCLQSINSFHCWRIAMKILMCEEHKSSAREGWKFFCNIINKRAILGRVDELTIPTTTVICINLAWWQYSCKEK